GWPGVRTPPRAGAARSGDAADLRRSCSRARSHRSPAILVAPAISHATNSVACLANHCRIDDPAINAVVITYPSSSLIRLMQAAGRCVRYAPGKTTAFVVQARNTDLGYYYNEGWLYQDISDALRPSLVSAEYTTPEDLASQVRAALDAHRAD